MSTAIADLARTSALLALKTVFGAGLAGGVDLHEPSGAHARVGLVEHPVALPLAESAESFVHAQHAPFDSTFATSALLLAVEIGRQALKTSRGVAAIFAVFHALLADERSSEVVLSNAGRTVGLLKKTAQTGNHARYARVAERTVDVSVVLTQLVESYVRNWA